MRQMKQQQRGQSMTEYIIIVLLCAIGLLGIVTAFGNDVRRLFWTSSDSFRGGTNKQVVWTSRYFDGVHNHTTGELDTDSPYEFNDQAGVWGWEDPATGKYTFVTDAEAGKYVDNIEDYKAESR